MGPGDGVMKFTYVWLALGLAFTGLSAEAGTAFNAGISTAAISKVDGDGIAKVRRKSGVESVAGVNQELFIGDRLTTDARTAVEIMLSDGTLVRIGLNSEYRLDGVEKKSGVLAWVFGLAKGSVRAMVEKNPQKNMVKFRVNTPVGTMGVRGTELLLNHDEKKKITTLYTIEGRVEFGTKNCERRRSCIEVSTGEMASVGEKPEEQKPIAKPADARAVFLLPEGNENDSAKDAATMDDRVVRAALFTETKNAARLAETANSIEAKSKGEVDKILKAASESMADAQDKLIDRTRAQREGLNESIKNGSYASKLKLAEKFDDLRDGSGGKGKDRETENLNANTVIRKLSLADEILRSKKMMAALEKQGVVDNELIGAKLKEAKEKLREAKEKAAAPTSTGTSTEVQTSPEVQGDDEVSKVALEKLDKQMVDAILKDKTTNVATVNYSYQVKECFLFSCWMETKNRTAVLETEKVKIERKSGICYETKSSCKREMIPCNLKSGKSCKPTFTDYQCKETKTQVSCPAQ